VLCQDKECSLASSAEANSLALLFENFTTNVVRELGLNLCQTCCCLSYKQPQLLPPLCWQFRLRYAAIRLSESLHQNRTAFLSDESDDIPVRWVCVNSVNRCIVHTQTERNETPKIKQANTWTRVVISCAAAPSSIKLELDGGGTVDECLNYPVGCF